MSVTTAVCYSFIQPRFAIITRPLCSQLGRWLCPTVYVRVRVVLEWRHTAHIICAHTQTLLDTHSQSTNAFRWHRVADNCLPVQEGQSMETRRELIEIWIEIRPQFESWHKNRSYCVENRLVLNHGKVDMYHFAMRCAVLCFNCMIQTATCH